MFNESLLTTTPHSCGPAMPPLHYMRRSMAMHLDHLQEEEGGHVAAGSFQLCHRTGQTCRVTVRACMAVTRLAYARPCNRTGKQALVMCQDRTSPIGRDTKFWLCHTWCHPTRKRLGQRAPGWLSKRLHYPSWMQEQATLVYPVDDTPGFLFLQTCLLSSELVSSNCHYGGKGTLTPLAKPPKEWKKKY